MIKLTNVWNVIMKVLTYLRTHPEELLVHKIFIFFVFEDRDSRMDIRTIFCGREVLWDEVLHTCVRTLRMTFQTFLILAYGPNARSWVPVLTIRGKSYFVDKEFFGMSSYICKNFQDNIPNIFKFCHMVLNSILDC